MDNKTIEKLIKNIATSGRGEAYDIETKRIALDDTYCSARQVAPGSFAKVSLTDTGAGMNHITLQRIFEPFFTTKTKSRGTGLGLASAYGIIKNHGGIITAYSELGHGSTFNIYLPTSDKELKKQTPEEDGLFKGTETILLVDDEEMITDVGKIMLEKLGYRVLAANGGNQAVEMISQMGKDIDMVILDLIMPVMDGGKTFDRIREIQSDRPVLLSSGYAINDQATLILNRGCNGFIQKPFSLSELSRKVRQIFDTV